MYVAKFITVVKTFNPLHIICEYHEVTLGVLPYKDGVAAHYGMYEKLRYVALLNDRRKFHEHFSLKKVWHLNKSIPSVEVPKCS
jgi:hypothetical protein